MRRHGVDSLRRYPRHHVRLVFRAGTPAFFHRTGSALPVHERPPSRSARTPALRAGRGWRLRAADGEIGTGKTTVCRCFLEQIPAHCNVAYIFNPKLTVLELLRSICDEFGVAHAPAVPGSETVKDCIDPLNAFLLDSYARGRNNVLIIDEAQNLAPDVLEQLRLLTNLETSERKLLQIILIGQPELRAMVAEPSMEQLAQRVIARYHLDALSLDETRQYVAHRLSVAGLKGPSPFGSKALQRVHALTGGVPRRINLLCDRSLLGAYSAGSREVSEAVVKQAAREVFDAKKSRAATHANADQRATSSSRMWWPVSALALALVAGGAGWALRGEPARDSAAAAKSSASGLPSGAAAAAAPASVASEPVVAASAAIAEASSVASQPVAAETASDSASSAAVSPAASQMSLDQFLARRPATTVLPHGRCWRPTGTSSSRQERRSLSRARARRRAVLSQSQGRSRARAPAQPAGAAHAGLEQPQRPSHQGERGARGAQ
uniref:ExeA family protein n=1 Tax=Diaphorobacter aerolatus TaxID=1288495 RepID=UPI00385108CF